MAKLCTYTYIHTYLLRSLLLSLFSTFPPLFSLLSLVPSASLSGPSVVYRSLTREDSPISDYNSDAKPLPLPSEQHVWNQHCRAHAVSPILRGYPRASRHSSPSLHLPVRGWTVTAHLHKQHKHTPAAQAHTSSTSTHQQHKHTPAAQAHTSSTSTHQ